MLNQDMGFTKDAVINIYADGNYPKSQVKLLADRLKTIADVQMVSLNDGPPAGSGHGGTSITYNNIELNTEAFGTDENYVPLYQSETHCREKYFSE